LVTDLPVSRCSFVYTLFGSCTRNVGSGRLQLQQGPAARRLGHDLTNQLSIILGFSEFLLAALPDSDPRRADVQEIDKAARTAMLLVSQSLLSPL
jgi:hypothetical protein